MMNTLARAWTLQIEISQCSPEDDPRGGVQTKRTRKGCTEERCQPGKADVRFVIPDGGVTVRGDFHASFRSVGVRLEEFGWIHLHTAWLPPDAGNGHTENLSAAFVRDEVDGVNKDARFPADWHVTFHYHVNK